MATTVVNRTFKDAQWLSDHPGGEGMVVSCYAGTSPSGIRPLWREHLKHEANDILVRLKVDVTDSDIAAAAAVALKFRPTIPPNVQAIAHDGHVTLTGDVEWLHHKEQAEAAVRHIGGLRGVVNHIVVTPRTVECDVRRRIVQSLHRNADLDARHIEVAVTDDIVTLTGTVGSWSQRAAERAAGSAPGIRQVDTQIRVVPQEPHEFEPPDEIC